MGKIKNAYYPSVIDVFDFMGCLINIEGCKFNRLKVIERVGYDKQNNAVWLCMCDCGKTTEVSYVNLKHNRVKSCGCYNLELISKRNKTHGGSNTKLYTVWQAMLQRCNKPKKDPNKRYYHRGIKVCPEWHKFILFKEWSIKNGYTEGLTIERNNNDKGYSPENCRWIPLAHQAWNTTRSIKYKGECASVASRRLGTKYSNLVSQRIKRGWPPEIAFTAPVGKKMIDCM